MKGILVLIFSVFFYPLFTAQDDSQAQNKVICFIAGEQWKSTYVFDITQVPERCEIFTVAQYAFDREGGRPAMLESDAGIITSLIEAKKTVYTHIGFEIEDNWISIFDPPDRGILESTIIDPLIAYLSTSKVNGIIMNVKDIYDIPVPDLAVKLSNFVSAVKKKVETIIVGIVLYGSTYEFFPDNSLFDYSISNGALDLYIIILSYLNVCDKDTLICGQSPITSDIPDMVTIDQVTSSVGASAMDKSKIYAMLQAYPIIPANVLPPKAERDVSTYSLYCSSTDSATSSQWCTNPSNLSYAQGAYANEFYVGIALEQLDTDDYESACGCGMFPVTNQFIDGFTGSPFTSCPKLDLK